MRAPRYLPDAKNSHPGRTCVYRGYDRAGVLLYVGITWSPKQRFAQHDADLTEPWWSDIRRMEIRWYPSRRRALELEWIAIQTEHPIHNKMHNPHYRGRTYVTPRSGPGTPMLCAAGAALLNAGAWVGWWHLGSGAQVIVVAALAAALWTAWGRLGA